MKTAILGTVFDVNSQIGYKKGYFLLGKAHRVRLTATP